MLLSSLTGFAITSVKIEGVLHEFSTIPGVVEDVTDIILNLKEIVLKSHDTAPKKIYLNVKKEGEVTAGDIETPPNVQILNPEHHIATLNSDTQLSMEMEVRGGVGYVPAELNKRDDQPIGVIPIDSLFSPVVKVNYDIEQVLVGQMADYEKLTLEVWTNGSILPQEAVSQAAKILKNYLDIFIEFEEVKEEKKEEVVERDEELEKLKVILNTSVDELELSVRSSNCLRSAKISVLGQLVIRSEQDMLKTRNFGKKSLSEIKEKLAEYGLTLGMEKERVLPLLEKKYRENETS
jgi:DNA-directed RNA polymerase subunit alpha